MNKKDYWYKRLAAFGYAFSGWKYLIKTQPNTWLYIIITAGVIIAGFWLQINLTEWAVLVLTFGLVWGMEMMNTAVEALVDMITDEIHPQAKIAKDVAAGTVFFCAIMAVLIGLIIFGPPLLEKLKILIAE